MTDLEKLEEALKIIDRSFINLPVEEECKDCGEPVIKDGHEVFCPRCNEPEFPFGVIAG